MFKIYVSRYIILLITDRASRKNVTFISENGHVHTETAIESKEQKPVTSKTGSKTGSKSKPIPGNKAKEKGTGKKTQGGKKSNKAGNNVLTVHDEVEDSPDEEHDEALTRAVTMPEREKTALSEADAKKIKINVYVKDENSKITLKDTVIKANDTGIKLVKSKTAVGTIRPPSMASISEAGPVKKSVPKAKMSAKGSTAKKVTPKKKKKTSRK